MDTATESQFCRILTMSLLASINSYGPVILKGSFDCSIFSSFSFSVVASVGGCFRKNLLAL